MRPMYVKLLLSIALISLVVGVYVSLDIGQYLSFEAIQEQRLLLETYVIEHPVLSVVLFSGLYLLAVIFSLPIATLLTLLGGFLFGTVLGTIIVLLVATVGSYIVFVFARWVFHDWFYARFGNRLGGLAREFNDHAFTHLLVLRLIPIFPFVLVNVAPAFSKITSREYVIASLIGMFPATAIYVHAGTQLADIRSAGDIFSGGMIIAFLLLALLALFPMLYKRYRHQKVAYGSDLDSESDTAGM